MNILYVYLFLYSIQKTKNMRVVLVGASGLVGSKILQELVDRGHSVKAIARDISKFPRMKHVEFESLDINETDKFVNAINAADAVISSFNAGWTNPNLYEDFLKGSIAIEKAVIAAGTKRFIVVGGAGSLYDKDGNQFVDGADFPSQIKPGATAARDYFNHLKENLILNWTFFSPALEMHPGTSGVRKGVYRTGLNEPVFNDEGRSILSAEDVAVAIVDELEFPHFVKQRFTAAY